MTREELATEIERWEPYMSSASLVVLSQIRRGLRLTGTPVEVSELFAELIAPHMREQARMELRPLDENLKPATTKAERMDRS